MLKVFIALTWLFLLGLCVLIVSKAMNYMDFQVKNILTERTEWIRYTFYFLSFYVHVFFGMIGLITGPFQFIKFIRRKYAKVHEMIGKVYMFACWLSAIGGFVIGFFAGGGLIGRLGFITCAVVWFITTFNGYYSITQKNFVAHGKWMKVSFAVTFAAVTLRVWIGVLLGVFGLEYDTAYQLVAWLSWVPNFLVVGVINFFFFNKKQVLTIS